jgi:uncharacterized protein YidB (DUF937 family)
MGLLDSVISAFGDKSAQPEQAPGAGGLGGLAGLGGLGALAGMLGPLLSSSSGPIGGLSGLAEKFGQAGLGHVVQSWIGNGANLPVSEEQLKSVLGSETITNLAAKVGIDPAQLQSHLAEYLPALVNHLTPNGALPAPGEEAPAGGLLASLGSMLGGQNKTG